MSLRQAVETVVNSGPLGARRFFLDLVTADEPDDNYASDVVFADVLTTDRLTGATVTEPAVIKRQRADEQHRLIMKTDAQFHNEVTMYERIIPYLADPDTAAELFPRYLGGRATLGDYERDVLVVEDLRRDGFVLAKEKLFLDFDHCAIALRKLAKLHSLSYSKKEKDKEEFLRRVSELKGVHWATTDEAENEAANQFLRVTVERGLEGVCAGPAGEAGVQRLREELTDPAGRMEQLCRTEEPLAVLCHGDFCRNNVLFRYDVQGRPTDVRLIDVATARYASPALDLAFFLTMNTSAALREERWGELVALYHGALTARPPALDLDTLRRELTHRLVYGYVICSFFIPIMVAGKGEVEDMDEESRARADRYVRDVAAHVLSLRAGEGDSDTSQ